MVITIMIVIVSVLVVTVLSMGAYYIHLKKQKEM